MNGITVAALALFMAAPAPAIANDQIIGFDCKDQSASQPDLHFNLDLKKRKWEWENGDVSDLELTETEARVPSNPFTFAGGWLVSKVLNRTTLTYVDLVARTDASFARRTTYQCVMVPAHVFGQSRKF